MCTYIYIYYMYIYIRNDIYLHVPRVEKKQRSWVPQNPPLFLRNDLKDRLMTDTVI